MSKAVRVPEFLFRGFGAMPSSMHAREMAVIEMSRVILEWFEEDYSTGSRSMLALVSDLLMQWRELFREFDRKSPPMQKLVASYETTFFKNRCFRRIDTRRRQSQLIYQYQQWWALLRGLYNELEKFDKDWRYMHSFSVWLCTQKFLAHFLDMGLGSQEIFGGAANRRLHVPWFRLGRWQRRYKRAPYFIRSYYRRKWHRW